MGATLGGHGDDMAVHPLVAAPGLGGAPGSIFVSGVKAAGFGLIERHYGAVPFDTGFSQQWRSFIPSALW
jgi:hypothetical protein